MTRKPFILFWPLMLTLFVTSFSAFGSCPVDSQALQNSLLLPGDLFTIELKNGVKFELSKEAPQSGLSLNGLSEEQREVFYKRRKEFLSHFVRYLSFPRLIGSMTWAHQKVRSCFGKQNESPVENIVRLNASSLKESGRIKRLGYETISKMVSVLDVEIWKDSHVFINAKSKSLSFLIGLSAGAAIPYMGFYSMRGLQFDFGYDFEKQESYFQRHWVRQKLNSAVFAFEAMLVGGVLPQYQVDHESKKEETRMVALPFGFAYRSGEKTAGFGYLGGLSLSDVTGVGLMTLGFPELGSSVLVIGKAASMFSLYSTKTIRTEIPPSKAWKTVITKLNSALKRCENLLKKSSS